MDWRKKVKQTSENNSHFQFNLDWIKKMNNAITFIENNLENEIDYSAIANAAHCSTYHFQRFFPFVAEIPLSEYIRRRRLTLAAFELQSSNVKVIDIALKYGYESPEAFTRAFKTMHGVTPADAKGKGTTLKAYPSMTFHISIKGDTEMNYRIEEKDSMEMFGIDTEISTVDNQNFVLVPKFWDKCRADGTIKKIRIARGIEESTPLHAAMYNCTDTSHSYMIGYFTPNSEVPEGFVSLKIPSSTWAIFPIEELDVIETGTQTAIMWRRIFTEWFATSGYELANVPELELHYNKGNGKFLTEIWIPVKR
jgi:AraC family transcriptional regulator